MLGADFLSPPSEASTLASTLSAKYSSLARHPNSSWQGSHPSDTPLLAPSCPRLPQLGPLQVSLLSLQLPNMNLLVVQSQVPQPPLLAKERPLHPPLPSWEEEEQEGKGRGLTQNNSGLRVNLDTERGGERPYWLGGGREGPRGGSGGS